MSSKLEGNSARQGFAYLCYDTTYSRPLLLQAYCYHVKMTVGPRRDRIPPIPRSHGSRDDRAHDFDTSIYPLPQGPRGLRGAFPG